MLIGWILVLTHLKIQLTPKFSNVWPRQSTTQINTTQHKSNQIKSNQIKSNQIKSNQIKLLGTTYYRINILEMTLIEGNVCLRFVTISVVTIQRHHLQFSMLKNCSSSQKTPKYKDDFIGLLQCIWCCYKDNSFTRHLLNHKSSERRLFTLNNFRFPCSLNYL